MAETSAEVVYVGKGKPSFLEKHTPSAHTEAMMRRYFWVTDHLEGKPREIAEKIRPLVEKSAKIGGWTKTASEVMLAASALAAVGLLGKESIIRLKGPELSVSQDLLRLIKGKKGNVDQAVAEATGNVMSAYDGIASLPHNLGHLLDRKKFEAAISGMSERFHKSKGQRVYYRHALEGDGERRGRLLLASFSLLSNPTYEERQAFIRTLKQINLFISQKSK